MRAAALRRVAASSLRIALVGQLDAALLIARPDAVQQIAKRPVCESEARALLQGLWPGMKAVV